METVHFIDNEQELAARIGKDPEAFASLYECYFPKIYNYIFCRVGQQSTADDLTSMVFEKALKKIGTYHMERARFSTWLFTIAKNTITDYFREQKKEVWLRGKVMKNASLKTVDVETTVTINEEKQHILQAIAALDERQQNIIGLKFWAGLKNTEIAEMTGISENNVAVILYRALKRLRVFLVG